MTVMERRGRGVEWIIVTDKQDDGMSEAFSRIAAMEVSVLMDVPRVQGRVRHGHVVCPCAPACDRTQRDTGAGYVVINNQ